MTDDDKAGAMPTHRVDEPRTLLPMLVGGLGLITVGMTLIAILF